jgi:thiamine biosynthesis lipoprotein
MVFLGACNENTLKIDIQGQTMGTQYHISVVSPKRPVIDKEKLKNKIDKILLNINQQMSTYITDSDISKFNQSSDTSWIQVPHDLVQLVKASQQISKMTDGAFDISISPLVDLWGFGAERKEKTPSDQLLQNVKQTVGYEMLDFQENPPALKKQQSRLHIDLSAIAKGLAVDKVSEFLSKEGMLNHLVEIGGEIRAKGFNHSGNKWRVAIETPDSDKKAASKILEITNRAVATSGDYRNFYVENGQRLTHIIDPKTGQPIKHKLASVTVLHESAMLADAFATALMVMGEDRGKRFVEEHDLSVYMIIREQETYSVWNRL